MEFKSGIIAPLIIESLRYYFSNYTATTNLIWDEDEKVRTLDIAEAYDYNKVALQQKPRITVARGSFYVNKVGLTDNLAQGKSLADSAGLKDYINMLMYSGSATVSIETRNKGTCELLTDMVTHFICWTRPILCDAQGWKEFGLPLAVSDISVTEGEDVGVYKFQSSISIPWLKEEHFRHQNDGFILKQILNSVRPT